MAMTDLNNSAGAMGALQYVPQLNERGSFLCWSEYVIDSGFISWKTIPDNLDESRVFSSC